MPFGVPQRFCPPPFFGPSYHVFIDRPKQFRRNTKNFPRDTFSEPEIPKQNPRRKQKRAKRRAWSHPTPAVTAGSATSVVLLAASCNLPLGTTPRRLRSKPPWATRGTSPRCRSATCAGRRNQGTDQSAREVLEPASETGAPRAQTNRKKRRFCEVPRSLKGF